jgi:hypothetical protein
VLTKNSFKTSSSPANDFGHGMLYALFAEAMICSILTPTFIMPRGIMPRSTYSATSTVTVNSGSNTDTKTPSDDSSAGHREHVPYCGKYPAAHELHNTPSNPLAHRARVDVPLPLPKHALGMGHA